MKTRDESHCLVTWAENDDTYTILSAKQGLPLPLWLQNKKRTDSSDG